MRVFRTIGMALALLAAAAIGCANAGPDKTPEKQPETKPEMKAELSTDEQKTVYALGLSVAQSLGQFALTPAEIELLNAGLRDGFGNTPQVDVNQFVPKIREFAQSRAAAAAEAEVKDSAAFLEALAAEKGAEKAASGMVYIPVLEGGGASPKATDIVKVHYKGTLRDGTVFDSSVERGQPATFPLNQVIPCWTEGVQKLKVGGKAKLGCPSTIAYGDRGAPPKIKPGAALLFEVELLGIETGNPAPALP